MPINNYVIKPGARDTLLKGFGLDLLRSAIYAPGIGVSIAVDKIKQGVENNPYSGNIINDITKDASWLPRLSKLGTPIFSDLQFGEGPENSVSWNGKIYKHSLPVDTALFTINQAKNIVKTAIQGRPGTIKEFISDGDCQINIKCIICGDNGVYPEEQVNNLIEFLDLPIAIPISSSFLELFDVYSVVVESFDLPQSEGSNSIQLVNINCVSDFPVELKIKSAS